MPNTFCDMKVELAAGGSGDARLVVADQDAGVVQWRFVPDGGGAGVTEHVVVADGPAGASSGIQPRVQSPRSWDTNPWPGRSVGKTASSEPLYVAPVSKRAFHSVFGALC